MNSSAALVWFVGLIVERTKKLSNSMVNCMNKTTHAPPKKRPIEVTKVIISFIGKSILVLLGFIVIADVIWGVFEGSTSVLEISSLEIFSFVVFFFLTRRHINAALECKMSWKKAFYLPLRNLGWLFLLLSAPIILILSQQENSNFIFEYEMVIELIYYIGVAICIYLAAPIENKNKESDTDVDAPVEANT